MQSTGICLIHDQPPGSLEKTDTLNPKPKTCKQRPKALKDCRSPPEGSLHPASEVSESFKRDCRRLRAILGSGDIVSKAMYPDWMYQTL